MRYRSVPAEVEAILWDGTNDDEVRAFLGDEAVFYVKGNGDAGLLWPDKAAYFGAPRWIVRQPTGRRFLAPTPEKFAQRWEPVGEAAETEPEPEPCKGYAWIGQHGHACDDCGRPWWEHEGRSVRDRQAGPLGSADDWRIEPWTGWYLERHEQWKREQEARR